VLLRGEKVVRGKQIEKIKKWGKKNNKYCFDSRNTINFAAVMPCDGIMHCLHYKICTREPLFIFNNNYLISKNKQL
jgi:hypothetical protein